MLLYIIIYMGDTFFKKIKDSAGSIGDLEESILGPDYKYYQFIKPPSELGMSSEGSLEVLGKNIKGLMSYTQLLVSGRGEANGSKSGNPLGNKFFMDTGATCFDVDSSNNVNRSVYVDNVPSGSIPFLTSGTGVEFTEFEGLIPGTLENITRINPIKIFKTFTSGSNPKCRAITMEVINKDNDSTLETKYITEEDISDIPPCSFTEKINPITKTQCREGFTTSGMSGSFGGRRGNITNARRSSSQLYSYSTPVPAKKCIVPDDSNVEEFFVSGNHGSFGGGKKMRQHSRHATHLSAPLLHHHKGSRFSKIYPTRVLSYHHHDDLYKIIPTEIITEREIISKSDFPEDIFVKIYFSALGLLGLYLLTKMIVKTRV
jgi:hypothetical protein